MPKEQMRVPQGYRSHLLALLLKNYQLKCSSPLTTLSEILMPAVFMLLLSIGYWLATDTITESELYGSNMINTTRYIQASFCYNESSPTVTPLLRTALVACGSSMEACLPAPLSDVCFFFKDEVATVLSVVSGSLSAPFSVMDIDSYLMMQYFTKTRKKEYGNSLFEHTPAGAFMHCGQLGLVGTAQTAAGIIRYMQNHSALLPYILKTDHMFQSLEEAGRYVYEHGDTLWAVLDTTQLSLHTFTIRMNYSSTPFTLQTVNKFARGLAGSPFSMYQASGFLSLQSFVSDYLISEAAKDAQTPPPPVARPFPTPVYKVSQFVSRAGNFFPLVMTFALLYPLSRLLSAIVVEKETKIRQVMFVMGLERSVFYISWFLTTLILHFLGSLFSTIVIKITFYHKADFSLLFVLNFLFAVSIGALGMLISVFFSKARIAAVVGPLLLFLSTVPHFAIPQGTSVAARIAASILPCTAYSNAIALLTSYVSNGPVGWESLFSDSFGFGASMIMMLLDIGLYLFVAWYLDLVLPSEYGTRRPPLFLFTAAYWQSIFGTKASQALTPMDVPNTYPLNVEPIVGEQATVGVQITGLSKTFPGDVRAVQGLDISFEDSKVTCLLGHNGAGKTTTMSCLLGMLPPTSGDAVVFGRSILTHMDDIRRSVGYCPQHNVLWPTLSVEQHLLFYAALRNIPRTDAKAQCETAAANVNLIEKYHTPSALLSGGQKRKLSVAIAFLGNSRFILLDEPTAGMDVHARRATWDVIQAMRPGRCILLSTHFMDEAELLGDRIAIMKKGRLHSCGTPLYLKSLLGVGHNMSISLIEERHRDVVTAEVMRCEPSAKILTSAALELSFRLPMAGENLAPLFEMIETSQKRLGVQSFGLSVTTMEEVFMRIAEEVDEEEQAHDETALDIVTEAAEDSAPLIESNYREPSFSVHLGAMFMKRAHCAKRDRRTLCFQVVLPGTFLALALLLLLLEPPSQPALVLTSEGLYGYPTEVLYTSEWGDLSSWLPQGYVATGPLRCTNDTFCSDAIARSLLANISAHSLDRYVALALNDSMEDFLGIPWKGDTVMHNTSAQHSVAEALGVYYTLRLRNLSSNPNAQSITAINYPFPMGQLEKQVVDDIKKIISAILIMIPFTFIPANFVGFIVKENECLSKHLQWVSGANIAAYWTGSFLWDLLSFLGTEVLAFIVFFAFQRTELVGTPEVFAATLSLFVMYAISSTLLSYLLSFFFTNHSTAQTVVLLGSFITGFLLVMAGQILVLFDSTRDTILVLMKGFRIVPSYSLGEALITLTQLQMVTQFAGETPSPFGFVVYDATNYGGFIGGVGTALVYMSVMAPLFFLALFVVERVRFVRWRAMLQSANNSVLSQDLSDVDHGEDPAVAAERVQVEKGHGRWGDAITVQRLCKTYNKTNPPKVAVKDLSFGVRRGEIFAFLGPNGAGKTTTLRILTGEQGQTSGTCYIDGFNVTTQIYDARKRIGFCPQFDGLLEHMTPRETLIFYATLRGLKPAAMEVEVNSILSRLDLARFHNTPSGSLSGGNKRKLSIAIALVGGPPVVILDEPSAGMDPVARRGLWKSLLTAARDRSIILTTHHLEEVEALAHRVAIITEGQLRCLGSLQDLKTKFGQGAYELQIRVLDEEGIRGVMEGVKKVLPSASHVETNGARVSFRVTGTALSEIFRVMEGQKEHLGLGVGGYSVNQTTLEQVFLRVCGDTVEGDSS